MGNDFHCFDYVDKIISRFQDIDHEKNVLLNAIFSSNINKALSEAIFIEIDVLLDEFKIKQGVVHDEILTTIRAEILQQANQIYDEHKGIIRMGYTAARYFTNLSLTTRKGLIWVQMFRNACYTLQFYMSIIGEVNEMSLNQAPQINYNRSDMDVLNEKSKVGKSVPLRMEEMRNLNLTLDYLKADVAIRYFFYVAKVFDSTKLCVLYDAALKSINFSRVHVLSEDDELRVEKELEQDSLDDSNETDELGDLSANPPKSYVDDWKKFKQFMSQQNIAVKTEYMAVNIGGLKLDEINK